MESGEMTSEKPKRTWKRLRFWGGIFLIVILSVGILAYVTYRKSLGPPPTPPGKSPEFDQHLADIDNDWLFLFSDEGRLFLVNIHGDRLQEILDESERYGADTILAVAGTGVSPGSRWDVISYMVYRRGDVENIDFALALLSLTDYTVSTLPLRDSLHTKMRGDACWLDPETVLVPFSGLPRSSSVHLYGKAPTTHCLVVSVDDLDNPQPVELPVENRLITYGERYAVDKERGVVLFNKSELDGFSEELYAYDLHGLRKATAEEALRFETLPRSRRGGQEPPLGDVPRIKAERLRDRSLLMRTFRRLTRYKFRQTEMSVDGRVFRTTRSDHSGITHYSLPTWDNDLELFVWYESGVGGESSTYYVDRQGRYRSLGKGSYCGKILAGRVGVRNPRNDEREAEKNMATPSFLERHLPCGHSLRRDSRIHDVPQVSRPAADTSGEVS